MKNRSGWLVAAIPVLLVLLLLAAYQMFRFPAAFRRLSNKALNEETTLSLRDEIMAKEDKKILVSYFSYSGTTKGVAETLRERLGADLFEIAPKEEYGNLYLQSNREIRRGIRPELSASVEKMEEYDIVFVGYPVWFHATPALLLRCLCLRNRRIWKQSFP